ncbi:ABC transporter permease, partial [Xenorhabdus bovienii]|nr:ABC transporter permease [Xenorhabdus bovienii]
PIVYMVSGFRYGFLGIADVSLGMTLGMLGAFIIGFYGLAWYLIESGRGLRT